MSPEQLAAEHPRLFHMAAVGRWESIRQHGLLSTTALLDRWEVAGGLRQALESAHRPGPVEITHPEHGAATIRDQKPMSDAKLRACLVGMTPEEWYRTLNRKVFFWLSERRLQELLSAKAYRNHAHLVLTLDTGELLRRHGGRVRLSSINSGATLYNPLPRGADTFLPIEAYPFEEWRRKRGRGKEIAELTVDYAVPDVAEMVLRAEHRRGEETELVWSAPEA